jgi:predicted metalloprotease with PDZ domain
MFAALLAALTLVPSEPTDRMIPVSLPSNDRPPIVRDGTTRSPEATPSPRKRFFGLGIRFQNRGGTQGISLEQVVAGSPAERAGFTVGMVIAEIEGKSTAGRSGEDCTRFVQEAGGTVSIKYYDPLTFKLRTRVVEKDWFPLPN